MTKSYKEIKKEKQGTEVQIQDACWSGYKQVGMKKKGNRQVPNCVPESVVNALFGKDYIYEVSESIADMYKGTLTPAQIAKTKQLWKTKKASDVTPAVKNFIKGLDQFTQMDLKKANIKYISDLIEEFEEGEVDLVNESKEIFQESEMRVLVRRSKMTENYFSADQLNRLAKAYGVMKNRTISVSNAKKLSDMVGRLPDHALNDVRKKKIPFISGLALSKMIQRKIPVTESTYEDKEDLQEARWQIEGRLSYRGINSEDSFYMVIDAPNESAAEDKVYKELDKARDRRKIGPGGGGSVEDVEIEGIERTTDKLSPPETFRGMNSYDPQLKEADLSKSQIKKVHKQADDLPKKDFIKRYGKDGDSVRYATATNMVKKKLGLGETNFIKKGELKMNETYKQRLTSAMEHFNISSLGELNEDDHKIFFSYVEDMKEGLSAAQKKLPPALQKAIAAKMKDKKEVKEDLVGGQKKLDKDKDGDLDAKDFAMLRKKEGSMKKEYGMPMKASYHNKMKKEEKTKETDLEPNAKKLNAMVKDPHKSHKGNPIDDMNAGYMKSDVKAPVKDGGGADMAKVKDKSMPQEPMKKIAAMKTPMVNAMKKPMNAMYGEEKKYLKTKPGSLEEAVLVSRGLIKK
jgi:predicted transcriptional regulator